MLPKMKCSTDESGKQWFDVTKIAYYSTGQKYLDGSWVFTRALSAAPFGAWAPVQCKVGRRWVAAPSR